MKKTLEAIGLAILICFSFIITDKTTGFIKSKDIIMSTVKENEEQLSSCPLDAQIVDNEIIPGISGKVVDIEKSYQTMKKFGNYNENLLVYKLVKPTITVNDHYDKYIISGNKSKKQVTLVFKDINDKNIDNVIQILNNNKIQANFFIGSDWINRIELVKKLSSDGHVFGRFNYNDGSEILKSIIKINTVQKKYYCYCEKKNKSIINSCSNNLEYTILPNIIINNSLLKSVMKNIESGSIISISVNNETLKELSNTIDYINSKGYQIVNLDTLLEE